MREHVVEADVCAPAEAAGFFVRKVAWIGRRGCPDRVFSREDRGTVWIEFKAPGKGARLSQELEHERMRGAGMEVHVCDSVPKALALLWIV